MDLIGERKQSDGNVGRRLCQQILERLVSNFPLLMFHPSRHTSAHVEDHNYPSWSETVRCFEEPGLATIYFDLKALFGEVSDRHTLTIENVRQQRRG